SRDERAEITGAEMEGSLYAWRHEPVHAILHSAWRSLGLGDAYLVQPDGSVLYSVTKSTGFLGSIEDGSLPGLEQAANASLQTLDTQNQGVYFGVHSLSQELKMRSPRDQETGRSGKISSFWAARLKPGDLDQTDQPSPVLIFEKAMARIASETAQSTDLKGEEAGDTLRTLLIVQEGRIFPGHDGSSDVPSPTTETVNAGPPVFEGFETAFRTTDFLGQELTVAALIPEAQAHAGVNRMARDLFFVSALGILAMGGLAIVLSLLAARPVEALARTVRSFAAGEHGETVPCTERGDEIGEIARAVEAFQATSQQTRVLEEQALEAERIADDTKRQETAALANAFRGKVGKLADAASAAMQRVQPIVVDLGVLVTSSHEKCRSVNHLTNLSDESVAAASAATEQLAISVQENSRTLSSASLMANQASGAAQSGFDRASDLGDAVEQIGHITAAIQDIASQTSLLALNATIEAARAGEAGRGFAIVASEVKTLANQTARATEDISGRLSKIQSASDGVIASVQDVVAAVGELTEMMASMAASVEQQGVAAQEIADSTNRAARGVTHSATEVSDLSEISSQTGACSQSVEGLFSDLEGSVAALVLEIDRFGNQIVAEVDGNLQPTLDEREVG
ncbi:MAG: methyl-accepting chemotaxis protein, partial [Pseudomonadota bacterium]